MTERLTIARLGRLGDGIFWYVLILLLPLIYGSTALFPALRMAIVGIAGLAVSLAALPARGEPVLRVLLAVLRDR